MDRQQFRAAINGKETDLYLLKNERLEVYFTNYGARIVSLRVNKNNEWTDVVMGFDSIKDYLSTDEIYHGTIVGRYANRIAKGKFSIDGQEHLLNCNNGPNHLHGGPDGFHNQVWDVARSSEYELVLTYLSIDGEEGYPGNLETTVAYRLLETEIEIRFEARSDKATVLNLTNHSYFNLNGQGKGTILDHTLEINANSFTPVDENLIPTGELMPVEGTPFDFRNPQTIGARINDVHTQLQYGGGYDHNYVLDKQTDERDFAARAKGDQSGIIMEVYTTEPGLQLYTGNFMKGLNTLKGGYKDALRSGFCLETQHFPDSPNHSHFPTTLLRAGEVFKSSTSFRFLI